MNKYHYVIGFCLALSACGQGSVPNDSAKVVEYQSTVTAVAPAKIVANNFSDTDWVAGVQTKEGQKNMFYFLIDTSVKNPISVGRTVIFAKSGRAIVSKVDTILQGGRTAVFVTVDHDLDSSGDGFPNQILIP